MREVIQLERQVVRSPWDETQCECCGEVIEAGHVVLVNVATGMVFCCQDCAVEMLTTCPV